MNKKNNVSNKKEKKVNAIGMTVGKIIFINEKEANIMYDGVQDKDARPYVYYKRCTLKNAVYVIPITGQFNKDGVKKQNSNWVPISLKKPSFIKTDGIRKISMIKANRMIWKGTIQVNENLPKQTLKDIKESIKKSKKS